MIAEKNWGHCRDQNRVSVSRSRGQGPFIIVGRLAQFNPNKPDPEGCRGLLHRLPLIGRTPIPEHSRRLMFGEGFLHELNPFHRKFDLLKDYAGNISHRAREAGDETKSNWIIIDGNHYNRNCACSGHGRLQSGQRSEGNNDLYLPPNEFLHRFVQPVQLTK